MRYFLLGHPGHNRVYFEASKGFMAAELLVVARGFSVEIGRVAQVEIAGVAYLGFETEGVLGAGELVKLSRLSFAFALFEEAEGGCLRPVALPDYAYVNPSISNILRYTGKTNESFTRMMINVAVASSDFAGEPRICLLDPVAGKGTTLYEGLACGYSVFGIEVGEKIVLEAYHFLKRFLETERVKHEARLERFSGPNRSFTAQRYEISLFADKEAAKAKDGRTAELIAGNSLYADRYYKKESMHVLVGDLPYGVQHGNITNEKQSSLTRNPSELLHACLPAWKAVLKPGGALVLAWNVFVLSREKMTALLESKGFDVLSDAPYDGLAHRVDQSILRDLIVARKR